MHEELKRMNDTLCDLTATVTHHVHRTNLLEDIVKRMDDRLSPIEIEYVQKTAVNAWIMRRAKFITKLGAAVAMLGGAWIYVKPWIEHLFK